jgi:hypothetical protein
MVAISIRYSGWQREYKVGPKLHFLKAIFPRSLNPGNHFPTFFKWFYLPKDSQPSGDTTQQHVKCCLQENTKLGWYWKPKPMLQTKSEGVNTRMDYKLLTDLSLWPNPSYTHSVRPFAVLQKYLPAHHRQLNTLRTGDADLRLYITTVQDGWRKSAFLTSAWFSARSRRNYTIHGACLQMVGLTDVYRNVTSLWINDLW